MNKDKVVETKLCNSTEFKKYLHSPFLKDFEEFDDLVEVSISKKTISQNTPIQVGFAVLQYAKLRMLEFYYDCLYEKVGPENFQGIETDTDSFYAGYTQEGLKKLEKIGNEWFPTNDEVTKIKLDNGKELSLLAYENFTPGLFKTEKEGTEMIGLASKSYILYDEASKKSKILAKGCQQTINTLNLDRYRKALNGEIQTGENKCFKMIDSVMQTYSQKKVILSTKYSKRVLMKNIYTRPYMPEEIDSEVKIYKKKYVASQNQYIRKKILEFL